MRLIRVSSGQSWLSGLPLAQKKRAGHRNNTRLHRFHIKTRSGLDQGFIPTAWAETLNPFTVETDDLSLSRERQKARGLRESQWWKRQLSRGRCHYCGRSFPPKALTMDHIVPLIRGGKSTKGNVVPACKVCNNKKKYMLPIEWEEYLQSITENGAE